MKRRRWITACGAVLLALTSSFAVAQDRGQDRTTRVAATGVRIAARPRSIIASSMTINAKLHVSIITNIRTSRGFNGINGMTTTSLGFSRVTCSIRICGGSVARRHVTLPAA